MKMKSLNAVYCNLLIMLSNYYLRYNKTCSYYAMICTVFWFLTENNIFDVLKNSDNNKKNIKSILKDLVHSAY